VASPLDESKDYQDANSKKKGQLVQPTPFLEESRRYRNAAIGDGRAAWIDDFPTLTLPTVDIGQAQTQVDFKAISPSSFSPYFAMDSLASLASPLVALVLAPFLTHTLSHTDYGALAVLNTAVALMAGITQLGLGAAFYRAYSYDYESRSDRLAVVSTVNILLLLTSVPTTVVTMEAAPWLSVFLLNSPAFGNAVRVAALAVLLQNLTVPGFVWLRAGGRAAFSAFLSIVILLVTFGANIVLVGVAHMGVAGSLMATGSGYAVAVACILPVILLHAGFRLRIDIVWNLLPYGLSTLSGFLSIWVLQLSDRYLLIYFGSLAQVASYSVAYTLGGVLGPLVTAPFSMAWYATLYAIAKRENAAQFFQLIFRWYSLLLLLFVFGLSLIATFALDALFPPAYHAVAPIIPVVALSYLFYGLFDVFVVGIIIRRKTWYNFVFVPLSALINVGLNLIFIPHFGAMGASISTLIAFVMLALAAYIVNQRIYPLPFEVGRFNVALLIGIVLYVASNFLAYSLESYGAWSILLFAFCLYGGCLTILVKRPARKQACRE
jgi:O-antigen/teichoic acid export membrane protein